MAMREKQEMLAKAEKAVQMALKQGATEAEAFIYFGKATSVGIERGQITKSDRIIDEGAGIRVQVQKAIGFAYTNILEEDKAIENAITKAIGAAKASKPDRDWQGFPGKKPYTMPQNTFDKRIQELHCEELIGIAARMLDAAGGIDKRIIPVEGGCGATYVSNAIANSQGITGFDEGTIVECSVATLAKEGSIVTPVCFEFNAERNYNIDPEWVGKEAARHAISALKAKRVETKNYTLILTQFALQELLYYTLINAVKADNVERDQSPFKGKLGERVGTEMITICDDGLLPGGMRTGMFDAEGVPHQRTMIIEKGILRNFLYDNYTARKAGKESTGNASRAGYLSTPSVEATNFHIIPGTKTPEELMQEVDNGLIVYYLQGAHSSNPVNGEFSVVATPAWKIRKGKTEHATRGVMLAGNIFELLRNVSALANNDRKMGQLVSPWILVENVRVIGR